MQTTSLELEDLARAPVWESRAGIHVLAPQVESAGMAPVAVRKLFEDAASMA
jgi:hypothetical protein